jgi:hypothetical protein
MKRTISVEKRYPRSGESERCNDDYEYQLCINVEGITDKKTLRNILSEINELEFAINQISHGEIYATKNVASPLEILDSKYDDYRYLARKCEN